MVATFFYFLKTIKKVFLNLNYTISFLNVKKKNNTYLEEKKKESSPSSTVEQKEKKKKSTIFVIYCNCLKNN